MYLIMSIYGSFSVSFHFMGRFMYVFMSCVHIIIRNTERVSRGSLYTPRPSVLTEPGG